MLSDQSKLGPESPSAITVVQAPDLNLASEKLTAPEALVEIKQKFKKIEELLAGNPDVLVLRLAEENAVQTIQSHQNNPEVPDTTLNPNLIYALNPEDPDTSEAPIKSLTEGRGLYDKEFAAVLLECLGETRTLSEYSLISKHCLFLLNHSDKL